LLEVLEGVTVILWPVVKKLELVVLAVPVNLDEVTLIILPLFVGKPADVTADRDWSFSLISAMSVSLSY
jgi:hypothetical protein